MKHSNPYGHPNGHHPSDDYPPPPAYSPPGQDPVVQMHLGADKQYAGASAPPPPAPGIHAPGIAVSHHQSSTSTSTSVNSPPQHHVPINTPTIVYANAAASVNPNPNQFGPYPMRVICPFCNAHIMTETHSTPGLLTYVLSGALCLLAPYLLCCLIPCCVRECKDIEHRCPSCQQKLGLFKRI